LWIGSQPRPRAAGHFDVIVLCAEELQNIPLQGAHVVKAPLDDYKPTAREVQTALSAARTVHILRKRGKRVLVTCAQGVNRSSLVAALALMADGMPAETAVHRIRALRKPPNGMTPLTNPYFVELLNTIEGRRAA
jgi:protein-tyrosine phosphatase